MVRLVELAVLITLGGLVCLWVASKFGGFPARLWGYVRAAFKHLSIRRMRPDIEIEQAVTDAHRKFADLKERAAAVIAHRISLTDMIAKNEKEAASLRKLSLEALGRLSGPDGDRWRQTAQGLALRAVAVDHTLTSLQEQYAAAVVRSDEAKRIVQAQSLKVQELAARRLELLGQLEQAKMQETVNRAAAGLTIGGDGVDLDSVESRIAERRAQASATAELAGSSGDVAELREAVSLAEADEWLARLAG